MKDPFGSVVKLPSFPDPDSFRRNVVPGMIPSPTLITEAVTISDLKLGDTVLFGEIAIATVSHFEQASGPYESGLIAVCKLGSWTDGNPYLRIAGPVVRVTAITFGLLSQTIPLEWIRDDTIRYYGKFDSQYAAYCWECSMDCDDRAGDSDMGWYAARVNIHRVDGRTYPARMDAVLAQWQAEIGQYPAGYIVHSDDRGSVNVEFFDSVESLDLTWDAIQVAESAWYDANESEV